MSAARARKVLIAAFAISLFVHFLLAGYIRWPVFGQSREEPVAQVHIMRVARIPPRTPPPPTPAPTPAATPLVHASIAPPPLKPHAGKGPARVSTVIPVPVRTPAPRVTVAPTPVATATPSGPCGGHANSDAAVASTPDPVDLTPQARASKVSGTAAIHVLLDPAGHVTDASVAQSSGNSGLDTAALEMARGATYTPKYVDCRPVAGDYTFTVKFVAW
jgi:TonB family protein